MESPVVKKWRSIFICHVYCSCTSLSRPSNPFFIITEMELKMLNHLGSLKTIVEDSQHKNMCLLQVLNNLNIWYAKGWNYQRNVTEVKLRWYQKMLGHVRFVNDLDLTAKLLFTMPNWTVWFIVLANKVSCPSLIV